MSTKTLKLRVKDKHAKKLLCMSRSVNFVWNFVNELSYRNIRDHREPEFYKNFMSSYDIQKYTKGASKELGLNSVTVQGISDEYATRRKQFKKTKLRWRVSSRDRSNYSLGWVPFKGNAIKYKCGQIVYGGHHFSMWDSYGLSQYEFISGSFNEDSRGRWYVNLVVNAEEKISTGKGATGIDLGCKTTATDSNGGSVKGREYRALEKKLGIAQRAKNKRQAKTIHAKIKNRRQDALHKYSRQLVDSNAAIFVGNVNSLGLVKTKMAKSVLDAGWGMLKTMLEYKCDHAGVVFEEVNEAYTTQTCSCCQKIPDSSPKGRAGLGIREWTCSLCGTAHDRDVNAAKNILRVGLDSLAEESPRFIYGE